MDIYDIAVIGAGPAGIMASIRAGQFNKNVILAEKNAFAGAKILLTGGGRCNVTNIAPIEEFVGKFGRQGNFLRTAFGKFSNRDLMDFFESKGLKLKTERQGRVFPAANSAQSVIETLRACLAGAGVNVLYNSGVKDVVKKDGFFEIDLGGVKKIRSKRVILASGGMSYAQTGSSGDGLRIAKKLGHSATPLKAALVPLRIKETWVKALQGISLENIRITFLSAGRKIISGVGELMFTHFGVSGPLVLDLSGEVCALIAEHKAVKLLIDLKPGLDAGQLEARIIRDFGARGGARLLTIVEGLLPKRMAPEFIRLARIEPAQKASQVTLKQRRAIIQLLKALPLTVEGPLSINEGMVTNGGISTKEINPRTMESRIIPGLYFAGEIIDGAAPSGGYNLQQAFSTGYLAGENAAHA